MRLKAFFLVGFIAFSTGWVKPLQGANAELGSQWVAYGQKLYAARQYDEAIKAFSTAARANSSDAAAWKGLGSSFYAKRDYASALKYYKYSLQLNPRDVGLARFTERLTASTASSGTALTPNALALAGRYYQARQYDEAIQQYNAALKVDPNSGPGYQGLGNAYYAKRDRTNAVKAYQRALAINPNNTALKNFLARFAPEAAQESGVQVASGPKEWGQPLWRSAVLPGWGQAYNDQTAKAWLVGGVTVGALGATVATFMIGDSARKAYGALNDSKADFDTPYATWESMANLNHIFAITFFTTYTFNLVDAYLNAKPSTHAVSMGGAEPVLQLGYMQEARGLGMKVRLLQF